MPSIGDVKIIKSCIGICDMLEDEHDDNRRFGVFRELFIFYLTGLLIYLMKCILIHMLMVLYEILYIL